MSRARTERPAALPKAGVAQPRTRERLQVAVLLMIVLAGVAWTHWPALSCQALAFDDTQYLRDNLLVRNPSWNSAWRFLSEVLAPSTVEGYYQPLTMISLMLNVAVGASEANRTPFQATNLALHLANTGLLLILLYLLFENVWAAAVAALLFGVHPLTVEPIPWLSERKSTLSTLFALGAMVAYVRYTHRPRAATYAALLVLYVLGLMAKPTVIGLPLMLLLMDVWPLRRIGPAGSAPASRPGRTPRDEPVAARISLRKAIFEKTPLLAIAGASAIITYVSQAQTSAAVLPTESSWTRVLLILAHNIVFYIGKILWPANLTSHYPVPEPLTLAQPAVLAGVVGTAVLMLALLLSLRWTRGPLVCWLIFFVAILPTMGVIGFTNAIAADKYVYFPAVGLLILLTAGLSQVLRKAAANRWAVPGVAVLALILAGAEAVGVRRYLVHWRDTEALCRRILQFAPNAGIAHMELSIELGEQGRLAESLEHAREAARLYPAYAKAQYNLGLALTLNDRLDEAIGAYALAVNLNPGHWGARYNLATALLLRSRPAEAIPHLRAAADLNPLYAETYYLLGVALEQTQQYREAAAAYERTISLNPNDEESRQRLAEVRSRL